MESEQYVTKQLMHYSRNQIASQKYLETNDNGNKLIKNMWDMAKAVLRGTFLVTCLISGNKKNLK